MQLMKLILTILVLMCSVASLQAADLMKFRISKPYCLLNFLQTTIDANGTSSTLKEYINVNVPEADSAFKKMTERFRNLRLDYSFTRDEYPVNRHRTRSTYDLIAAAAVNATDLDDFNLRIAGILPNTSQQQLLALLRQAETYYDPLIWNKYLEQAHQQLQALQQHGKKADKMFVKLARFYQSGWSPNQPFTVALYLIPGISGNTTATPHANNLCVGILTGESDNIGRMSVILHEMCHVLYDEQPDHVQHQLEGYFATSKSPYAALANNFFDEGMATALGNGWGYKQLKGTEDTTPWYNNIYIDGFGHALYPLVSEYLEAGKAIDSNFVARAISLFEQRFPNSVNDYGILLNRVTIYIDGETEAERNSLMATISKYFQVSNSNLSSPILHEYSKSSMRTATGTQLLIVDRNFDVTQRQLASLFPELQQLVPVTTARSWYVSFFDSMRRPVIIVKANNPEDLESALAKMEKERYINPSMPFHEL